MKPTAGLSAVERVDIYANMYFYRIRDVLREEFARTVAVIGDDTFHNLITDYLVACRPAHPSLREAGARLPDFLSRHPLTEGRASGRRVGAPRANPSRALRRSRRRGPDTRPAARLLAGRAACPRSAGHPVSRRSPKPVRDLWQSWKALTPGESADAAPHLAETLLVWRQDVDVFHRVVDAAEEPVLALIRDGARFDAVCERLLEAVPEDQAAIRAFEILGRWVADGLIAAARSPDESPGGRQWMCWGGTGRHGREAACVARPWIVAPIIWMRRLRGQPAVLKGKEHWIVVRDDDTRGCLSHQKFEREVEPNRG